MKKMMIGLYGLAVLSAPLMAENLNEEKKQEQTWAERHKEAIQKQMQERSRAFNQDKIQANPRELEKFLVRQREVILALEREKNQKVR